MILFDITPGQLNPCNDKPRSATDTERNAYLRWLAEHRGVDISGCSFDEAGAYRGTGADCVYVLDMPGYGDTRRAIMETLDEAGEVIGSTPIAIDRKGFMVIKAKQVHEACGLKAKRASKAEAAQKPAERVQPQADVVEAAAPIVAPAPVAAAQPVQSTPPVDSDLVARVAALEATLARVGIAVLMSAPIAANDDAPAAPLAKRTAAQERAIRRAWEMRRTMRERADLDRRALMIANGDNRFLHERLQAAEAKAADFERIAIAEATRADDAQQRATFAQAEVIALNAERAGWEARTIAAEAQAANARDAATAYKREGDAMERLARASDERAHNAESRVMRMVRAASGYRTRFQRERQDARAARAEARAIGRRLEALRNPAPAPAATPTAMATAFAAALN